MRQEDTPQDNIAIFQGERKALYASSDGGEYSITPSSGWSIEEMATLQAVEEFKRQENEAYQEFLEGNVSPIAVWMYRRRMSFKTLCECSGLWQWQVKRHLKPNPFTALSPKKRALYCDIFDITFDELCHPKETV